jgi:ADP-ribose pyrophosphatase YjhB (NUDIX family)
MTMGGPRILKIPEGDNRERKVCPDCGFIQYDNPKVVVGSVVTKNDRILLCRRAIDPRKGFWTLPAGYLELHESTEDGARREAQEEASAALEIEGILAVYTIPRASQVQVIYRARLASDFAPGPESLEVKLFSWDEIPWRDLAFPSVHWALRQWREGTDTGDWKARTNPAEGL